VRVFLREVRVSGNTALSDAELSDVTSRYQGREVSSSDLAQLRDELTLAYVNRGYVSSGAVIPDQPLAEGILEVQIVEGRLDRIEVETDGRFRESHLRRRLEIGARGPVNVYALEDRLQIMQRDPRVQSLHAELLPGAARGESTLHVRVFERPSWEVLTEGNNYQSPTIGSWGGKAEFANLNVTGFGDQIRASFDGTDGLREVEGSYEVPLTSWDTSLTLHALANWSEVVEEPFSALDIESNTQTYGVTLTQPAYRTLETDFSLFLTGEWRRSKSFLLGQGFSFIDGPDEGESRVAVLRTGIDWVYRTRSQVLAARSMLSFGLDVLGATDNGGDTPDGQFVAWLGQAQFARRFALLASEVIARLDVQVSDRPLLGLEQFAMGGHSTVRGYRENTLVRDDGLIGSLELRVPVLRRSTGIPALELCTFVDTGYSWNTDRGETGPTTLVSAGIGARANVRDGLGFEIYWGQELEDVPDGGGSDLQNHGVHLGLRSDFP
jgi:hemolysin activation/secretion protein